MTPQILTKCLEEKIFGILEKYLSRSLSTFLLVTYDLDGALVAVWQGLLTDVDLSPSQVPEPIRDQYCGCVSNQRSVLCSCDQSEVSILPDLLDLGPLLADDGAALCRGHAQPQHQRPRVGRFAENQLEVSIMVV